jgi:hypothetical protein
MLANSSSCILSGRLQELNIAAAIQMLERISLLRETIGIADDVRPRRSALQYDTMLGKKADFTKSGRAGMPPILRCKTG